jgi:PPOX class probable F420-dependent enzyme
VPITLTEAQRAFLDRPLYAVLATPRPDGTVSQSVVWYHRDGDEVWISTAPESAKARLIRRDPRVSLLVPSADGSAYLALEGTAAITEDVETPDRLLLMRRYVGDEGARAMVRRRPLSRPNARLRIRVERVTAYNLAD